MTHRVLLPWQDVADRSGRWPGLDIDVYTGTGQAPDDVSGVEFYVVPYDRGQETLDLVARMPALRAVQSLSAGVEKLAPLVPAGATLCNGRGLHDASTAEHALALILAAQREMPRWVHRQVDGVWDHDHTGSLAGSRVTIVGYGAIGQAVERRLLACEALVAKVASRARPSEGVRGVPELARLLPETDILVLALPERPETVGLADAELLAALPDGALVVNVGRGRTLDTSALVAETKAERLRAALDVVDPEPLPSDHPLWRCPGVLITPHVAGGSAGFEARAKALVEDQLDRFATGEPLRNVVAEHGDG